MSKEICNVVATLYPAGHVFWLSKNEYDPKVQEEYFQKLVDRFEEDEDAVSLDRPTEWVHDAKFLFDRDEAGHAVLKHDLICYEIDRMPLGFASSEVIPFWSGLYEGLETEGYKTTFELSLPFFLENVYRPMKEHFAQKEPKDIWERMYSKRQQPPFLYSVLVEFDIDIETSRDWESGQEEIDFIDIEPVRIINISSNTNSTTGE